LSPPRSRFLLCVQRLQLPPCPPVTTQVSGWPLFSQLLGFDSPFASAAKLFAITRNDCSSSFRITARFQPPDRCCWCYHLRQKSFPLACRPNMARYDKGALPLQNPDCVLALAPNLSQNSLRPAAIPFCAQHKTNALDLTRPAIRVAIQKSLPPSGISLFWTGLFINPCSAQHFK